MTDLNDDLSDLLGAAKTGPALAPIYRAPDTFVPAVERVFTEACSKCRGSGKFISWSGRTGGDCFACKGTGKHTFKTAPEARAKARAGAQDRKAKAAAELTAAAAAYTEAHADAVCWCIQAAKRNADRGGTFDFPQKMIDVLAKFGSWTEGQLAAVEKLQARDAERTAARAEAAPVVASEGIDRLKAAFDAAIARTAAKGQGLTLRSPKITIGGITISPAKATSQNPGALYVKAAGEYLGKIAGGKFMAVPACTPEQSAKVLAFVNAPEQAAKAYGQETGVCCVCNAALTSEWRLRGIGPVCAEKFGW